MDVRRYLSRIGFDGSPRPSADTLRALHRAHLLSIPFEALDAYRLTPLTVDRAAAFDKIVEGRRGGFCFELNGLFSWLLEQLGFTVTLLSARPIQSADGELAPPFAHLTLLVELEERWLADVGFGYSFLDPLRLDEPGEQRSAERRYRIAREGERWWMQDLSHDPPGGYAFDLSPRALEDFAEMCTFYSSDPTSPFARSAVWAQAYEDGWLTVTRERVIELRGDVKTERPVTDEAEWRALVREHAGVHL